MSSLSLSHIPRRFQVALLVVLGLVVLWVAVLRNAGNSGSSAPSAPATPAPATHHPVAPAHTPTRVGARGAASAPAAHHASALSGRDAALAHRAGTATGHHAGVAASGKARTATGTHAHRVARAHALAGRQHARPAAPAHRMGAPVHHVSARVRPVAPERVAAGHRPAQAQRAHAVARRAPTTHAAGSGHAGKPSARASAPVKAIEGELAAGQVALVLFWNPAAVTDRFVHQEVQAAGRALHGRAATHFALAGQVGEYGRFAQKVLITETPSILVIAPSGQVTMLAGFNEAESIKRAVEEARASSRRASAASAPTRR